MTVAERLLRNQGIRNLIPPRIKASFAENRVRLVRVTRRSQLRNVYHCCVHKTGSQWVRKVLADPAVYRNTGLRPYAYAPRLPPERRGRGYHGLRFEEPLPRRTIVSPLYISAEGFRAMPKPEPWRAFFVGRDPRDIVVSWYFSALRSHPTVNNPSLRRTREQLEAMSEEEGLIFAIDRLAQSGLFRALREWWEAPPEGVLLVRYEDLIGPWAVEAWDRVFDHCDVALDPEQRRELLERYSFRRLSGRHPGQEDPGSKLRKGVAGDWRHRFTAAVRRAFEEAAGDLATALGYGAD